MPRRIDLARGDSPRHNHAVSRAELSLSGPDAKWRDRATARCRRRRLRRSRAGSNISGCCRSRRSRTSARLRAASGFGLFGRPSAAEVTTFTRDLALLLKAGARLDDALELLASDADVGRLRPVVGKLRAALLSGESLADAVAESSGAVSPDVRRAGSGRRSLGYARPGARDAGRGTGAIRSRCAASSRMRCNIRSSC